MKKYLLLFVIAIFVMSCSKKVEVKGKITGGSPLERIEFIEASGVATLPLINIGVNKDVLCWKTKFNLFERRSET
jgi:hypothetical protein